VNKTLLMITTLVDLTKFNLVKWTKCYNSTFRIIDNGGEYDGMKIYKHKSVKGDYIMSKNNSTTWLIDFQPMQEAIYIYLQKESQKRELLHERREAELAKKSREAKEKRRREETSESNEPGIIFKDRKHQLQHGR